MLIGDAACVNPPTYGKHDYGLETGGRAAEPLDSRDLARLCCWPTATVAAGCAPASVVTDLPTVPTHDWAHHDAPTALMNIAVRVMSTRSRLTTTATAARARWRSIVPGSRRSTTAVQLTAGNRAGVLGTKTTVLTYIRAAGI